MQITAKKGLDTYQSEMSTCYRSCLETDYLAVRCIIPVAQRDIIGSVAGIFHDGVNELITKCRIGYGACCEDLTPT
jgi:hypothetical protein